MFRAAHVRPERGQTLSGTSYGYTYDLSGNRTSRSVGGTSYPNSVSATSNRNTGLAPYAIGYDAAGNMTADGASSSSGYGYSARGRLSAATSAAGASYFYRYNGWPGNHNHCQVRDSMSQIAPSWTAVSSKSALESAVADERMTAELLTAEPNEWGFFRLLNGKILVVGYANLGLLPVAALIDNHLLVGIGEILACFDVDTLQEQFSYRMPSVFHEFVSLTDAIVVRDEVGFVGISIDGGERWKFLTSGPINRFSIERGCLHGETIDGEPFEFSIPS